MSELEDLKVGDKVIVGGAYSYCRIRQVEKVTKKHVVVEGNKFSKEFGWIDGCSSYTSDHIRPATEEDIRRVKEDEEKRGIIKWLENTIFEKLSYETLVAIRDIIMNDIGKCCKIIKLKQNENIRENIDVGRMCAIGLLSDIRSFRYSSILRWNSYWYCTLCPWRYNT